MRERSSSVRLRPARSLRRAAIALAVLALGACGTPPPTHFHSLMPLEVAARPGAPAAAPAAPVAEDWAAAWGSGADAEGRLVGGRVGWRRVAKVADEEESPAMSHYA